MRGAVELFCTRGELFSESRGQIPLLPGGIKAAPGLGVTKVCPDTEILSAFPEEAINQSIILHTRQKKTRVGDVTTTRVTSNDLEPNIGRSVLS
ncbi:hypothetical protein JTE90_018384 [Oedothorax gibbosus]|uniref:Uncharacterized protein n=1 Tax=Oedothorax gibbosus TaxID=931172 RepID=A0AAV6UEE5_9ARAC|nr:hypothetical protein JTE90_018384 [Oedothorax gibbosus]